MYQFDFDLCEACKDYIGENSEDALILHHDYNGIEVCEKYLAGNATGEEIRALYKFFGIIPDNHALDQTF